VRVPFPVRRRAPNTSKIEEAIGWRRTRDLDEILADLMTALQDAAAV
jgi:nucleoside-diphosphate-sugar epimerase